LVAVKRPAAGLDVPAHVLGVAGLEQALQATLDTQRTDRLGLDHRLDQGRVLLRRRAHAVLGGLAQAWLHIETEGQQQRDRRQRDQYQRARDQPDDQQEQQ
jgi:hypothetical protein